MPSSWLIVNITAFGLRLPRSMRLRSSSSSLAQRVRWFGFCGMSVPNSPLPVPQALSSNDGVSHIGGTPFRGAMKHFHSWPPSDADGTTQSILIDVAGGTIDSRCVERE